MDSDQPVLLVRPEGINAEIKALAAGLGIEVIATEVVQRGKAFIHYPQRIRSQREAERRNLLLRLTRGDVS
jgi:hypothetical protein